VRAASPGPSGQTLAGRERSARALRARTRALDAGAPAAQPAGRGCRGLPAPAGCRTSRTGTARTAPRAPPAPSARACSSVAVSGRITQTDGHTQGAPIRALRETRRGGAVGAAPSGDAQASPHADATGPDVGVACSPLEARGRRGWRDR